MSKTADKREFDLRERLFKYAGRIIEIVKLLPRSPECDVIRKQLMAAGTSVGANYEEADGAVTKRDFVNKIAIVRKEANETRYWLRLISGPYIEPELIKADITETTEIIKIFSAILTKSRGQKSRG
jgi:four helix bundle protein